jgi:hypothetical protein
MSHLRGAAVYRVRRSFLRGPSAVEVLSVTAHLVESTWADRPRSFRYVQTQKGPYLFSKIRAIILAITYSRTPAWGHYHRRLQA